MGTIVDVFAVLVFVALVASSIRRYILTPPGLQRTWDASIVVSLIAALMVTFVLAEAGGHVARSGRRGGRQGAGGLGPDVAARRRRYGQDHAGQRRGRRYHHVDWASPAGGPTLFILLFFLVYLPYSKHMHLIWAPFAVFLGELAEKKGVLERPARRRKNRPLRRAETARPHVPGN